MNRRTLLKFAGSVALGLTGAPLWARGKVAEAHLVKAVPYSPDLYETGGVIDAPASIFGGDDHYAALPLSIYKAAADDGTQIEFRTAQALEFWQPYDFGGLTVWITESKPDFTA